MQALAISPVSAQSNGAKGQSNQSNTDQAESFEDALAVAEDGDNAGDKNVADPELVPTEAPQVPDSEADILAKSEAKTPKAETLSLDDDMPVLKPQGETSDTPETPEIAKTDNAKTNGTVLPPVDGPARSADASRYASKDISAPAKPVLATAQPGLENAKTPAQTPSKVTGELAAQLATDADPAKAALTTPKATQGQTLPPGSVLPEATLQPRMASSVVQVAGGPNLQVKQLPKFELQPTSDGEEKTRFELKWPADPKSVATMQQATTQNMRVQIRPAAPAANATQAETLKAGSLSLEAASAEASPLSDTARGRAEPMQNSLQSMIVAQTRTEMSASIARQIATLMHRAPERTMELSLSPAELGSVRLKMSPVEAGIAVSIMAERPETLDLMRRNISALEQAMTDIGFEDVAFSFDLGSEATQDDSDYDETQAAPILELEVETGSEDAAQIETPAQQAATSGLDIRI